MIGAWSLFSLDGFHQPVLAMRQFPVLPIDKTYPYIIVPPRGFEPLLVLRLLESDIIVGKSNKILAAQSDTGCISCVKLSMRVLPSPIVVITGRRPSLGYSHQGQLW